jgi:general secretion pathway protein C
VGAALLCALAAASAVFWGVRIAAPGAAAQAVPEAQALAPPVDARAHQLLVARLLGAMPLAAAGPASVAAPAQRFALLGVVARAAGQGVALISVDGQPARPLRVGALIAPGYRLQAVGPREAVLVNDAQALVQIRVLLPARGAASVAAALPAYVAPAAVVVASLAPLADAALVPAPSVDDGPLPRADSRRQPLASPQRSARPDL